MLICSVLAAQEPLLLQFQPSDSVLGDNTDFAVSLDAVKKQELIEGHGEAESRWTVTMFRKGI